MGGNAREMKSNFHRILDRRCIFYDNVVHRFVNETTFVGLPPSFVPRPRRKTVAEKWQKCLGRFPRTKLFHAFPLFFFGVEPRTTFVKLKIVSSIMRLFFFSFHLDRFSAGLWREEERKRRRAIRDRLALFIKVSLARRFPQEIGEIISDNESGLLWISLNVEYLPAYIEYIVRYHRIKAKMYIYILNEYAIHHIFSRSFSSMTLDISPSIRSCSNIFLLIKTIFVGIRNIV